MEIKFKIKESMKQVVDQIYSHPFYRSIPKGLSPAGWDVVLLHDHEIDSYATAYVSPEKDRVEIETAWSGFKYKIFDYRGETFVRYNGAFNGLLAQALLPVLNPVEIESAIVSTSLKNTNRLTYGEYVEMHKKFTEFKATL